MIATALVVACSGQPASAPARDAGAGIGDVREGVVIKDLPEGIGTPCLDGPVDATDIDPSNPGLQLDCTVADVVNAGSATETGAVVPPCEMTDAMTPSPTGARPCF